MAKRAKTEQMTKTTNDKKSKERMTKKGQREKTKRENDKNKEWQKGRKRKEPLTKRANTKMANDKKKEASLFIICRRTFPSDRLLISGAKVFSQRRLSFAE